MALKNIESSHTQWKTVPTLCQESIGMSIKAVQISDDSGSLKNLCMSFPLYVSHSRLTPIHKFRSQQKIWNVSKIYAKVWKDKHRSRNIMKFHDKTWPYKTLFWFLLILPGHMVDWIYTNLLQIVSCVKYIRSKSFSLDLWNLSQIVHFAC